MTGGGAVEPPGVAAERTALAWQRSAMAVLLLSVLTLGLAARFFHPLLLLTSAASTVTACGAMLMVLRQRPPGSSPAVSVIAVGVATAALALAGVAWAALALAGVATAVVSAGADLAH